MRIPGMPVGVAGGELVVELLDMGVDAANVDIDMGVGVDAVVGVEAWHEKLSETHRRGADRVRVRALEHAERAADAGNA